MKKIVLTGGGTAGHVTPNIALIPSLQKEGFEIYYIGSKQGIEKSLIEKQEIKYFEIDTGKFRRYLSIKNLSDPFRILNGLRQAVSILKKIKPDIVFSKGGFVSVPVVIAASFLKIPVVIHESDMTPGLANKICIPRATKICYSFPETLKYLPDKKSIFTDSPIREDLFLGDKKRAEKLCNFNNNKPIIMVFGGSSGSIILNNTIRFTLNDLLKNYNIIHLCGKNKTDAAYNNINGYVQLDYAGNSMKDFFALSDIVISRAGANSICELKALAKPNILIPLSKASSRGDQILNALSYEKHGYSLVIKEEELTKESLINSIDYLFKNKEKFINNMKSSLQNNPINSIINIINDITN